MTSTGRPPSPPAAFRARAQTRTARGPPCMAAPTGPLSVPTEPVTTWSCRPPAGPPPVPPGAVPGSRGDPAASGRPAGTPAAAPVTVGPDAADETSSGRGPSGRVPSVAGRCAGGWPAAAPPAARRSGRPAGAVGGGASPRTGPPDDGPAGAARPATGEPRVRSSSARGRREPQPAVRTTTASNAAPPLPDLRPDRIRSGILRALRRVPERLAANFPVLSTPADEEQVVTDRTGGITRDPASPDEVRHRAWTLLGAVVEPAVFGPGAALSITAHHVAAEPIPPAEAPGRRYAPFAVGDAWGPRWGTTWFRLRGRIPAGWAGQEVVLRLESLRAGTSIPGGEYLIFRPADDGRLVPLLGLSPQHAAASLTASAAGGEDVDLFVEAAANPTTPEDPMAGFDWPELRPDPGGPPGFVLTRCELAVRRPAVRALATDLRLAAGLAAHLDAGSAAAAGAHAALAGACAALDPADVPGTAAAARAALAPLLVERAPAATNGHGPRARVTAVGHAHIDTAWLWPLRETVRKCARTFATAVTLMEEFPEY